MKNQPVAKTLITSDQLPSPKGKLLIGNLSQFKAKNKHQVMEKWVEEVGEIFKINLLGKCFIVSANPSINKEILRLRPYKFRRYGKIDEILQEMGVLGVFNAEGETWKKHRRITSEALNRKHIEDFFPTIASVTNRLITKWSKIADTDHTIDVQKEMMRYTVDITTAIAFGYPMNTLEEDDDVIQQHLEKVFPMINSRITAPLPLWRIFKSKQDKDFDIAIQEVRKTVHQLIEEGKQRLKENEKLKNNPRNFLEALLVQQSIEGKFTDKEIFGNVFTMLLAGEDTTSNTISWTLYYLAQYPDIALKVRQEAKEILKESSIPDDFEKSTRLKYTEAVVQESLRIKPVTPNLYMQALEDVEINGYLFKENETVMMQNKVPQTDENNFFKPNEFIPERWLKAECPVHHDNHKPDLMRAFGGGSRLCPGKGLAMNELVVAISSICKNFELELAVKPDEVNEVFAFTMFPENLLIRLKTI